MRKLLLIFMLMMMSFSSTVFAAGVPSLPLGLTALSSGLSIVNYAYANLPMSSVKTPEGYQQVPSSTVVQVPSSPPIVYTKTLDYTGGYQTWTVPTTGAYKLEVWGAQGGNSQQYAGGVFDMLGGKGGYAYGQISLTQGQVLYVYVGGMGGNGNATTQVSGIQNNGGWNGGGSANETRDGGGGGATDVRIGGQTLNDRVIVAGAGGGADQYQGGGGDGGGLTGSNGVTAQINSSGSGGTQSTGGTGGLYSSTAGANGALGLGGSGAVNGPGGGGGWYGGGGGTDVGGGGGGSSYVGGVTNGGTTSGSKTGDGKFIVTRVN